MKHSAKTVFLLVFDIAADSRLTLGEVLDSGSSGDLPVKFYITTLSRYFSPLGKLEKARYDSRSTSRSNELTSSTKFKT